MASSDLGNLYFFCEYLYIIFNYITAVNQKGNKKKVYLLCINQQNRDSILKMNSFSN